MGAPKSLAGTPQHVRMLVLEEPAYARARAQIISASSGIVYTAMAPSRVLQALCVAGTSRQETYRLRADQLGLLGGLRLS